MNFYKPLSDPEYSTSTNLKGLDLAKFICSILVVSIHITPFTNAYCRVAFNWFSNLCVPFFFISSAWLAFRNVDLSNFTDVSKKIKKTCVRIFFIYLIWTIIYLPLAIIEIAKTPASMSKVYIFFRNFLFAGSYGPLWYLLASVWGLGIIYFLLKLKLTPKTIFFISIPFFIFGLCASSYFGFTGPLKSFFAAYLNLFNSVRNGIFMGFPIMSLGLLLTTTKRGISKTLFWVLLMGVTFIYMVENAVIKYFNADSGTNLLIFLPLLVVLIFFGVIHLTPKITPQLSVYLRDTSVIIYLSHMYLGKLAQMITSIPILQFLLTLIFAISFASLLIEIRKKYKNKFLKYLY